MNDEIDTPEDGAGTGTEPSGLKVIFYVASALVAAGLAAAIALRPGPPAPSPDLSGDPLLTRGNEIYQTRCYSCHGREGRGDGPISKAVGPTPPGDLTDSDWKHGDRPEQVVEVIAKGVRGTAMAAWEGTLEPEEIRAVAAYVFRLASREEPAELRETPVD